jgi:hypothetical protein
VTIFEPPGHHARDGWFFRRDADGAVVVTAASWPGEPKVILDPHTWASVVASVSAAGETAETYRQALAFHAGPSLT